MHEVLAVPARARILELVRASREPLTTQQLSDELDLHPTTVRFHLRHLESAGLVVAEPEPVEGRGRPRLGYRPGALDVADVREQMIDALAEALADGGSRDRALRAGRRWAERLPAVGGGPVSAVTDVFTQLGFDPDASADPIRLRQCPFMDAARRTPQVVCQVHLGLAQGLVARTSRSSSRPRVELRPFAEPNACLLSLTHTTG
jgi:predicted ArsR family transcriptional regulator